MEIVGSLLAEMTTARAGGKVLSVTASDSTGGMMLRKRRWAMGGGRWVRDELTPSLSSVEKTPWRETAEGGREARERLLAGSTGEKRGMEQVEWRGSEREKKAAGVRALCDNPCRFLHFPASLTFDTDDNDGTKAPPHHLLPAPDATCSAKKTKEADKQRDPPKP